MSTSTAQASFTSLWASLVYMVDTNLVTVLVAFAALMGLAFAIHLVRKFIQKRKV